MSPDPTTTLWCESCRALTAHVHTPGGYVCTTETEDRTCGQSRTFDATVEDAYGVGLLSEAWATRDAADATALGEAS